MFATLAKWYQSPIVLATISDNYDAIMTTNSGLYGLSPAVRAFTSQRQTIADVEHRWRRLTSIKSSIRSHSASISSSVNQLYQCLGEIQAYELYREIDLLDFTRCLASRCSDLNYNSNDYALIGSMMIRQGTE